MSKHGKTFSLLVTSPPWSSQAHITALNFAKSLIQKNHHLYRVFFYSDATTVGINSSVPPQDEFNLPQAWLDLSKQHNIDLVICISAGIKRGILNTAEQDRYSAASAPMTEGYELSGLGQLVDAIIQSDRVITF
jgi:tRNA 2-thiouridine synthesizing protein D